MRNRVPPHNLDAEQSVLGALMADPYCWDQVASVITEEDFYHASHQKIFLAIRELYSKSRPVDIITVSNYLSEKKELDSIGGPTYLAEVINSTPTTAHAGSHAKIVRDKALLRKVIHLCSGYVEKSFDEAFDDVESFVDTMEAELYSLSDKKEGQGLVGAAELIKTSIDKLTELFHNKPDTTGVGSGFTQLDKMTSGFQPGELTIIAARPSMGKTAFSLNIAQHAAVRLGKSVAYFSVEMAKDQLMMRLLASEARINLSDLRVGNIQDSAWPRLIDKASKLADTKLYIDDSSGISPFEIRAKARRLKATHGLDLIMIDYLQLMDLKQKVESRERAVSEISKSLKALAKELQIPVIALAQLNRGVEGRSDRRPMLSDLRESGSIEQDADVIMLLYREDYYDRENSEVRGQSEVIIGKQRNGPTGTVKLKWDASVGRFTDLEAGGGDHPMPPPPPPPNGKMRNYAPGA